MTILLLFLLYAVALSTALALAGQRSDPDREVRAETANERASDAPRRLLVVGATGGTGRELVARALDRGYEVTALVRDPSKLGVEHPRLRMTTGDVLDYPSVEAAMPGHQAVVSALGHKRWLGPSRILSRGTRNLLRAMEAHAVPRIVCETSLGIGDSAGRMGLYYTFLVIPLIVPFYFWDKTRQEREIARSRTEWVIVRPAVLNDRPGRGWVRHGRRVGSYLRTVRISRADVADFMLEQLESNEWLGRAVGVSW